MIITKIATKNRCQNAVSTHNSFQSVIHRWKTCIYNDQSMNRTATPSERAKTFVSCRYSANLTWFCRIESVRIVATNAVKIHHAIKTSKKANGTLAICFSFIDSVERWKWSKLNLKPKIIPLKRVSVLRWRTVENRDSRPSKLDWACCQDEALQLRSL